LPTRRCESRLFAAKRSIQRYGVADGRSGGPIGSGGRALGIALRTETLAAMLEMSKPWRGRDEEGREMRSFSERSAGAEWLEKSSR